MGSPGVEGGLIILRVVDSELLIRSYQAIPDLSRCVVGECTDDAANMILEATEYTEGLREDNLFRC